MSYPRNPIVFSILYAGEEHHLKTFWGEYRDLRALINDQLSLEDFGQCGGMGRCATCMVEISGSDIEASPMERNELTTLSRQNSGSAKVRLSCQIPINDDLTNAVVKIVD